MTVCCLNWPLVSGSMLKISVLIRLHHQVTLMVSKQMYLKVQSPYSFRYSLCLSKIIFSCSFDKGFHPKTTVELFSVAIAIAVILSLAISGTGKLSITSVSISTDCTLGKLSPVISSFSSLGKLSINS